MLKTGILGRRDSTLSPSNETPTRASPEHPRYPPEAQAPAASTVANTNPVNRAPEQKGQASTPTDHRAKADTGLPRLTVGPNIKLKGAQIDDCDTLVVEGHVEAAMDSKSLEIMATGSFDGTVTIDVAEIHGRFTGSLTARKKLVVHSTGQISGTVRYGALLVSEGGVVSGDIAQLNTAEAPLTATRDETRNFAGYPSSRAERQAPAKEVNHAAA